MFPFSSFSFKSILKPLPLLFLILNLAACQNQEQKQTQEAPQLTEVELAPPAPPAAPDQSMRRPAPEFHKIPTEKAQDRVFVCEDATSDVFHTSYDCSVLSACASVKKNVTLLRAVESYGCYNCETCSKDMAYIFDDNEIINNK